MAVHTSAENYLEAILMLQQKKGSVRSIDVADELSVSKPSVSVAMKKLRAEQCIEIDSLGLITLLPKGLEIAQKIYARHRFMADWLVKLGIPPQIAEEDACRIEHDISPETFEALQRYVCDTLGYFEALPRAGG